MVAHFLINAALLFGGAVVTLVILRAAALRLLPDWLAGPGGLLIDTRSRLGMLDLHDPAAHPTQTADPDPDRP